MLPVIGAFRRLGGIQSLGQYIEEANAPCGLRFGSGAGG